MTERWDTVAGVDEAGRGPLAGPVVAAAVMLDPQRPIDGLTDSKQLTARRRDALDGAVRERALAVGIARAEVAEFDALNLLHARLAARARAVAGLNLVAAAVRVDGNRAPALAMPTETVVGGDRLDAAIAAASIVAKVERDRLLVALEATHPGYGFAGHKGYGTRAHLEALYRLGPCPAHRRSFAPVRKAVAQGRLALEE
jgi:ribonuclease HII